jgi:hypothetical protein
LTEQSPRRCVSPVSENDVKPRQIALRVGGKVKDIYIADEVDSSAANRQANVIIARTLGVIRYDVATKPQFRIGGRVISKVKASLAPGLLGLPVMTMPPLKVARLTVADAPIPECCRPAA